MASDKKLIIANWKMNLDMHEASLYLHKLSKMVKVHRDTEVVLAPTSLTLQSLSLQVNLKQFKLAAQNFYWRDSGTYTGEISATQLRGVVQYALVGHSERRHIFNESDKDVRNKVAAAIRNNIRPVLCIGETAWEHANNETKDVIHDQLAGGLANITGEELEKVVIAYEPVWAISAGLGSTPVSVSLDDVKLAFNAVRNQIKHLYGQKASESIQVLYGGSVTGDSVADYLSLPGVNGLLVGWASLNANTFNEILEKAHKSALADKKE
ncbi:MAG: triose-phosphate isomerase [Candidatus Saccharibacteria bacterium]|nr:triose-phosphate isomerase [Candidatus Saccharibacteria bacterium]